MPVAEHVGQFADLLRIGNGLVKRHGEIVRAQNGKVGIVGLAFLIGMSVDDRQVIIVILLTHEPAGVLAEGTHLVFKGLRITDQLGFIQHAVDKLHDFVAHFHADADVNGAGLVCNVVLCALMLQPFGTAPSGCHDGVFGQALKAAGTALNPRAQTFPVLDNQFVARMLKINLHTARKQQVLDRQIDRLRALSTQMADGAVHQLQPSLDGVFPDFLDFRTVVDAFDFFICAELQINAVGIVDGFLHKLCADQIWQVAADLVTERELSVRKGARAGETGCNVAVRTAVHTAARFFLGAMAAFDGQAFFDHDNFLLTSFFQKLQRRKDTGGAGADDEYVRFHEKGSFYTKK